MSRAHSAGSRNRKSRSCDRASQVVYWIAMPAREIWASQADDRFHLSWRYAHSEQFSGEPQIDDAPVNLRKAFRNTPTLHPGAINTRGSLRCDRAFLADVQARVHPLQRCSHGLRYEGLHGGTQQILGGTGQDRMCFYNFDPRSRTRGIAACRFLIGEARQSSQVTPVRAGQIASIGVSQLFTDGRGYGRFQGSGADTNPSLQMARASLQHHTRLMAIGSHERKNRGSGMIQVEENIASVALLGIGQKINIMPLKVACAEKAHHRSACQLTCIPNSFSGTRSSGEPMNHAEEIEIIRHGRELTAHSVPGKKQSAIAHGHDNAIEASRDYNDFSANGNNPLNSVSQSKGAPQLDSPRCSVVARPEADPLPFSTAAYLRVTFAKAHSSEDRAESRNIFSEVNLRCSAAMMARQLCPGAEARKWAEAARKQQSVRRKRTASPGSNPSHVASARL